MPMFFFHVIDDVDAPDNEGSELPDIAAAEDLARHSARSLMCETIVRDGRITLHHRIDIEDEQGEVVASVPFSEAVQIET